MTLMFDRLLTAGTISAAALLLAACGDKSAPAETATDTQAITSEAMPAEELPGDMGMDGSAMDATAEMAPPADPMMEETPAQTPAQNPAQNPAP